MYLLSSVSESELQAFVLSHQRIGWAAFVSVSWTGEESIPMITQVGKTYWLTGGYLLQAVWAIVLCHMPPPFV